MKLTAGQLKLLKQVVDAIDELQQLAAGKLVHLGPEPTRRIAEQLEFQGLLTASGGNIIRGINVTLVITDAGIKVL